MTKGYKPTLQMSILGIFVTLFLAIITTIILITNYSFTTSLTHLSREEMAHITDKTEQQLRSLLDPVESITDVSASLIENDTIDLDNFDEMLIYTYRVLKSLQHVEMVYWGDTVGNFVISRKEANNSISSEIINRSITPNTREYIYRNAEGEKIDTKKVAKLDYDPRNRPWYKNAIAAKHTTWSEPYVFYTGNDRTPGITSATPVYKNDQLLGVFGIDLRLKAISSYLKQQTIGKTGLAAIIDAQGDVIAFPNLAQLEKLAESKGNNLTIDDLEEQQIKTAFNIYKKNKLSDLKFNYNGVTYLAAINAIPRFINKNWYIVIVVAEDDFIGELKKINRTTLTICLFIFALGILLITTFSKKISHSLTRLTKETNQIKNFKLSSNKTITSHIKEINILSEAITAMRNGLKAFKKYVPADLVRQLLVENKASTGVNIGGEEKEITIMFTDIANFTTITENTPADRLMEYLCEYFDELTHIIKNNKGTIDKYIGDAIMAFWNAPTPDELHCEHACQAAISIQIKLAELNRKWQAQGRPAFITRIGLTTGPAIVGNIGSYNRLNYTTLGDTINQASRYEALNKIYGSDIIVDQNVKIKINGKFVLRTLDRVAVRGKTKGAFVYQLITTQDQSELDKINWLNQQFSLGYAAYKNKKWAEAIQVFSMMQEKYPDDKVAKIFIERCKMLQQSPPNSHWNGIWYYKAKKE